jgi:Fe-S cluster assembly ATPase SufC
MPSLTELNDVWVLRDGRMVAEGDAKVIDELLEKGLVELGPVFS